MSVINTADSRVAAQAVHDLGAALWFGGSVMGVAGVNKSGADLRDGIDKVRVADRHGVVSLPPSGSASAPCSWPDRG